MDQKLLLLGPYMKLDPYKREGSFLAKMMYLCNQWQIKPFLLIPMISQQIVNIPLESVWHWEETPTPKVPEETSFFVSPCLEGFRNLR